MKSVKKIYLRVSFILLAVAGILVSGYFYRYLQQEKIAKKQVLLTATPTHAPTTPIIFEEGKHYHRISHELTAHKSIQEFISEDPGKIQVIEFFNYGCFWCSRLHPILISWAKTKPVKVVFYSIPVVFNKKWETLAKAYFIVKNLGKTETLDSEFFRSIHQNHVDLGEEKKLKEFFNEKGVPEKQFSELYQSFTVNSSLARAVALANAYHIALSPVIVVNAPSGSYLLTAKAAGTEEALKSVLNYVIAEESKKLGS
ncbi:MAG TPA: thiol:disulfide interchange protein DsbA/DsbL [Gammaproteobacteria bacterium]|nr:thiol:disulfide interchange protein DsbA/DsbL [Gammaproteobacteria bacterium]